MSLSCTTVEWRGITLSSDYSSPFGVRSLAGWDERPASRLSGQPRPGVHGRFASAPLADERVVTLGGQIVSPQDRDTLLHELDSAMAYSAPGAAPETLTITRAGRRLSADAYLTAFRTPTDLTWGVGAVPFAIEWRCADPLRYADAISRTTGFAEQRGGLEFPLFTDGAADTGFLEFGEQGSTGRVTLPTQPGTAPGHTQFLVTGPVPPFSIVRVESGRRITFARSVAAGDRLLIDSATGVALLNDGDVDYSGLLTYWEWEPVQPGESVTFAFIPDGVAQAGTLTVIHRAAWW